MTRCTVAVCTNSSAKTKDRVPPVSYHRFPKTPHLRKAWVERCNRAGKWNPDSCHICSDHFTREDFLDDVRNRVMGLPERNVLKPDAAPSKNLKKNEKLTPLSNREKRFCSKQKKEFIANILNAEQDTDSRFQRADEIIEEAIDLPHTIFEDSIQNEIAVLKRTIDTLKMENLQLKEVVQSKTVTVSKMRREIKYLKSKTYSKKVMEEKVRNMLSSVFTSSQLDLILCKKKRINWTSEDISTAFAIRYFSKRCYKFLRKDLKYPLPGLSTLQRYASKLNMRQGILTDVMNFLQIAGCTMTSAERLIVLQFDEVKVKARHEYDKLNDEVVGPHSQMQVVMARGLIAKWKQPIYIDFDKKMTPTILNYIISKLNDINYEVVACTSDCGGGNVGLWRDLDITYEKPWFVHSQTGLNIYFFADAPHMLKLLRNWLIDTGFKLEDGKIINKEPLVELIRLVDNEVSVCFKLTEAHITCEKSQRQNVKMASQLLSHSTATALKHYNLNVDKQVAVNTGDFIELVNAWFDLMNTYRPEVAFFPSKSGYGLHLENQNQILDEMYNTVKTMRCIGKRTLQIFQKGILMSINSLKALRKDMNDRYGLSYILTHKVNQDSLENFFSQLRTRGGLDDHPTPLNALYRIRLIILGKNPGLVQSNPNTIDVAPEEYMVAKILQACNVDVKLPPLYISQNEGNKSLSSSSDSSIMSANKSLEGINHYGETADDAIEYLAGWVAYKFKSSHPDLGNFTYENKEEHDYCLPSWVGHLSFGGLKKPSPQWFKTAILLDKIFNKHHQGTDSTNVTLRKGKGLVSNLVKKIVRRMDGKLSSEIITTFIKQRTMVRLNYLNDVLDEKSTTRKRRLECESDKNRQKNKKLKKIVL